MIAERWGFSRAQLDEFALASHEKAAAAPGRRRRSTAEIAPVTAAGRHWSRADEGIRRGGTLEKLAELKTRSRRTAWSRAGNAARSPTARPRC